MGADPEPLGTGPWEGEPVALAPPLRSQAEVVMGVLGQGGWSPVDAAATAVVAASGAAPGGDQRGISAPAQTEKELVQEQLWHTPGPEWQGAQGDEEAV